MKCNMLFQLLNTLPDGTIGKSIKTKAKIKKKKAILLLLVFSFLEIIENSKIGNILYILKKKRKINGTVPTIPVSESNCKKAWCG